MFFYLLILLVDENFLKGEMHLLVHELNCFTVALGAAGSSKVFLL